MSTTATHPHRRYPFGMPAYAFVLCCVALALSALVLVTGVALVAGARTVGADSTINECSPRGEFSVDYTVTVDNHGPATHIMVIVTTLDGDVRVGQIRRWIDVEVGAKRRVAGTVFTASRANLCKVTFDA